MSAPVTVVTADDNNSYALGQVRVWVMPATPADPTLGRLAGYTYPWAWSSWAECKRLIPISATRATGSMGTAAFRMLRYTRTDPRRNWPVAENDEVIEGAYVCITIGTATAADPSDTSAHPRQILDPNVIAWIGYITQIRGVPLKGAAEMVGAVEAHELGGLLDAQQIYGWGRFTTDSDYPEVMTNPPTANLATPTGTVIGNAKQTGVFDDRGVYGSGYVFARTSSDCGTDPSQLWTNDRLLRHLLALCRPAALPPLTIASSSEQIAIEDYLDDHSAPEVFELRNLTWKGALDMLVPHVRGLGWFITVDTTGWRINLFSYAESNAYGLPANSPTDITLSTADPAGTNQPVDSVRFTYTYDMPDEVVIEGNPIVSCGSVAYADGNLTNGWTAAQEAAYLAGASKNLDGSTNSGYPGDATNQKILNAAIRESSSLRDVFTRFVLQPTTIGAVGDVRLKANAGTGGGADRPFCPELLWNGSSLSANLLSNSRTPYLPTARVLRTIPWPEGVRSDGTDTRDATSKAIPQFLPLRVLRYDVTLSPPWRDQNAQNGRPALPSMSVEPDDHGPGVRVHFSPPEILAKGHWTGAEVGDINPDAHPNGFDWHQLVLTIAIESDQRVRVSKRRQTTTGSGGTHDISGSDVRVRLVIPAPDLHCWFIHVGTVLGLLANGDPDRVTATADPTRLILDASTGRSAGYLARNDFAVAEKRAKQAAAFLFRQRAALQLTRARIDALPAWASLGYMVGSVVDTRSDGSTAATPSNTVVTSLAFSFGDSPRVTVATDLPTMPGFAHLAGAGMGDSPTAGGAVSVSLSGTTAQAVSRLVGPVATAMDRDSQRMPIVHNRAPQQQPIMLLQVIDGAKLYDDGAGTVCYGVSKTFSFVRSVGTQYDPDVSTVPGTFTSTNAGIGRALIMVDGVWQTTPVLIVLDGASPVPVDLISGEQVVSDTQVTITGPSGLMTAWLVKLL